MDRRANGLLQLLVERVLNVERDLLLEWRSLHRRLNRLRHLLRERRLDILRRGVLQAVLEQAPRGGGVVRVGGLCMVVVVWVVVIEFEVVVWKIRVVLMVRWWWGLLCD